MILGTVLGPRRKTGVFDHVTAVGDGHSIRQAPYPGKDEPKQAPRNGDLCHLEGHVPRTPHDLGLNLDQFIPERNKRPMLDARRQRTRIDLQPLLGDDDDPVIGTRS